MRYRHCPPTCIYHYLSQQNTSKAKANKQNTSKTTIKRNSNKQPVPNKKQAHSKNPSSSLLASIKQSRVSSALQLTEDQTHRQNYNHVEDCTVLLNHHNFSVETEARNQPNTISKSSAKIVHTLQGVTTEIKVMDDVVSQIKDTADRIHALLFGNKPISSTVPKNDSKSADSSFNESPFSQDSYLLTSSSQEPSNPKIKICEPISESKEESSELSLRKILNYKMAINPKIMDNLRTRKL